MDELNARYLLKGMQQIQTDAINLGERDFLLGPEFILKMKKEYEIPFISANIFYPDSTTRFVEPYVIKKFKSKETGGKKIGSLTVGIFGLVLNRPTLIYQNQEPKLITRDPIVVAREIVDELEDKCDLIVVLAHLPTNQLHELTTQIKGIDIIIGGHAFGRTQSNFVPDTPIILESGSKGQYAGDIRIELNKEKSMVSADLKNVSLDKQFADAPSFAKLLDDYNQEFAKLLQQRSQNTEN